MSGEGNKPDSILETGGGWLKSRGKVQFGN